MQNNVNIPGYSSFNTYIYDDKSYMHQAIDFLSAPLRIAFGGNRIKICTHEVESYPLYQRVTIAVLSMVIFPVGIIATIAFVAKKLSSESLILKLFLQNLENNDGDCISMNYKESPESDWKNIGKFYRDDGDYEGYEIFQDSNGKKYFSKYIRNKGPKQLTPYYSDKVNEVREKDIIDEDCFKATVMTLKEGKWEKNLTFAVKKDALIENLEEAASIRLGVERLFLTSSFGKRLESGRTFAQYDIKTESKLFVSFPLYGKEVIDGSN